MKKVFAICTVALLAVGFTSCKKCGHCEDEDGDTIINEICDGNVVQDAAYASAQSSCSLSNGTWVEK